MKPSLLWGDLSEENIIVRDGELAGLVDFEGVLSGDWLVGPGFYWAHSGDTPFFNMLWSKWPLSRQSNAIERLWLGAILRGLRIAPYAATSLPTGEPRTPLPEFLPMLSTAALRLARSIAP
jgi:hypothetical protein